MAVDVNPRQNALLELKLAAIRGLRFEDFFAMFGRGRLDHAGKIYAEKLRSLLSPWSQTYWDRKIEFFEPGNLRSFYFRGTSGAVASLVNLYIDRIAKLRPWVDSLLVAASVDEQRSIYENHLHDRFWSRAMRFFLSRNATLSLVGVPPAQRLQVETQHEDGILNSSTTAWKPYSPACRWRTITFGGCTFRASTRRTAAPNISSPITFRSSRTDSRSRGGLPRFGDGLFGEESTDVLPLRSPRSHGLACLGALARPRRGVAVDCSQGSTRPHG